MSQSQQTHPPKPLPTAATKPNRLPAPTLFVGPPSRNASQLSVSRQVPESSRARDPLNRQKSALSRPYDTESTTGEGKTTQDHGRNNSNGQPPNRLRKDSERSVDARWREMQNTLNEVEMTAQSSTHVFGESHATALDALRKAQVELAQAWGRGSEQTDIGRSNQTSDVDVHRFKGADDLAADRVKTSVGSTGPSTRRRGGSTTG